MKLMIALMLLSINTYAASNCDLTVSVPTMQNQKVSTVLFEGEDYANYFSASDEAYVSTSLKQRLLKECTDKDATDCKVTNSTSDKVSGYNSVRTKFKITVTGLKVTGGKKISDVEYAKTRTKLICERLDVCINNALNDDTSSQAFLEKLYLVKSKSNCNQVENIIFQN